MNPVKDLWTMVTMPFKAAFVVGLCGLINWMTYSGTWWVKWVALGMGIATLVAWAKGLRTAAVLLLAFFVGRWIYRRYGAQARTAFDQWVKTSQPKAAEVIQAFVGADPRFQGDGGVRH